MKFEHTEVWGFEHALRGMRNPKNSWDKSDSRFGVCPEITIDDLGVSLDEYKDGYISGKYQGIHAEVLKKTKPYGEIEYAAIGDNDMKLAQTLINGGSEHRKFLRQIFVSVDITAPLYWWKEFDTYKVGTVANSTSTMHKLATTPITMDCFETDDYQPEFTFEALNGYVDGLEELRKTYLETKDKLYWKELIRWLPESWLQTRTITMNYENLYSMVRHRGNHKLNEWSGKDNPELPNFISWVHTLPYSSEFIFVEERSK